MEYTHEEVRAIIKFVLEEERQQTIEEKIPEVTAVEKKEVAPEPVKAEKPKKKSSSKKVDHGRIMALYHGKYGNWSVKDIAEDVGCSEQTVRNTIARETGRM